jgi:hypothetical protein
MAGTVLLLLIGFTEALAVEEIKKDNIGPWEIEAAFKTQTPPTKPRTSHRGFFSVDFRTE